VTIREYIVRRGRLVQGFSLLCVIALLAMSLFFHPSSTRTADKTWILVCVALVFSINWVVGFLTKCPRCKRTLGSLVSQISTGWGNKTISVCPHCGVNLDEPADGPPLAT
jgi:hypothetical protein